MPCGVPPIAVEASSVGRIRADRIRCSGDEKQTYVLLGPGPGHLPEGFKGKIQRCESVFVATPLFGFADDHAEYGTPAPNRDGNREAKFAARSVEFSANDGKRMRAEW